MKADRFLRTHCLKKALAVCLALGLLWPQIICLAETPAVQDGTDAPASTGKAANKNDSPPSYAEYRLSHAGAPRPTAAVVIHAAEYRDSDQTLELFDHYEGSSETSILTGEDGFVEWLVNVPETGLYNLSIRLYPYEGKGGEINRSLTIDGISPFEEAQYLSFTRTWREEYTSGRTDGNGNDIRPDEVEVKRWNDVFVTDSTGFVAEPFSFYLTAGAHSIRLTSEREPLLIESLRLCQAPAVKTYAQVLAEYREKGYQPASGDIHFIQAEDMAEKSSASIFPLNDRDSSATQPQDIFRVKLNSMGGQNWQNAGAWVSWKIRVDQSGLYTIAPRFRQNFYDGSYVSRRLTINGEVPFEEAQSLRFDYGRDWSCKALGDEQNGTYQFYFEAGREYELAMEVVLGDMGDILTRVQKVMDSLNAIYREILIVTGPNPDTYRDYYFEEIMPDTLEKMKVEAGALKEISDKMVEKTGKRGEQVATLDQLVFLLEKMTKTPSTIGGLFNQFKDQTATLGSWIYQAAKQPLSLDYVALVPAGKPVPKANGGFFTNLSFGFQSFLSSFFLDYRTLRLENVGEDASSVTAWLTSGRDQQTVIRQLIDGSFTQKYNTSVDLKLVGKGTLLPSVLAGRGPDVALSNTIQDVSAVENPIDFAVRNAVMDLSGFEGFDEVVKQFHSSALVPFQFNGGTYALPETQNFNMMFVRTDIFEELGMEIPGTWDELDILLPELQKMNMTVGLPHDLNALLTFMYQRDTPLYRDNGAETNLDSQVAMQCFQKLMEYFTLYKLPTDYDFFNRFRSGEIPLAIQDYTAYNQLTLFAPEIRGDWVMAPIPGTVGADGKINNTNVSIGNSAMMLKGARDEAAAWNFLKWWVSAETQGGFSNQMQAIQGAGMQATANIEALAMLPWPVKDYKSINEQWKNVQGRPEVPGGYYTVRTVDFAFSEVYSSNQDPGDTLQSYIDALNSELTRKRKEFGLQ